MTRILASDWLRGITELFRLQRRYLSPRMTGRRTQVRREEVILAEDADMDCEADLGTTGS